MQLLKFYLITFIFSLSSCQRVFGPNYDQRNTKKSSETLIWCTINQSEQKKCTRWAQEIENNKFRSSYPLEFDSSLLEFNLKCVLGSDRDHCLNLISNNRAHLINIDPGELFSAGRYFSLIPIMAENYDLNNKDLSDGYYSVAVVKRISSNYIKSLADLKNTRACFPGVGQMAGWIIPMSVLLEENLIEVVDCNNLVKSASKFFNSSCSPNALSEKQNPSGDNPQSMCSLCHSSCSSNDLYSNFGGAFQCLLEKGEVAFLKQNTVDEMISHLNKQSTFFRKSLMRDDFELLCKNGERRSLDNYRNCNWGFVPSNVIVTISSIPPEKRARIQNFLQQSAERFSKQVISLSNTNNQNLFYTTLRKDSGSNNSDYFRLLGESHIFGERSNLLFSDDTKSLTSIPEERQTFNAYLGDRAKYFTKIRKCPVPTARLCVVSEEELNKCNRMRNAFRAQLLKPELSCVHEYSTINCMKAIKAGTADLVVLDAGDIYRGGLQYNLIPIVAEQYDLDEPKYYVVAVSKQPDKSTDLLYLKGKSSCHGGYGKAAGWIMPLSFLLSNNRMRSYGCDSAKAASQFFQKSCTPGALSNDFAIPGSTVNNLCDLCHGTSYHFCSRDSSEPFYGDTGALRCLIEGGGDIAFVKHTTILENSGGHNPSFWSRNVIPDDFELLCRDGRREGHKAYRECNLGKVASNAIVTSKFRPKQQIDAYINLFIIAQQLYGSKYSEDYTFKMFVSKDDVHDLIFQDATTQLVVVPEEKRDYLKYLDHDLIKAIKLVDCTSGVTILKPSITFVLLFTLFYTLFYLPMI